MVLDRIVRFVLIGLEVFLGIGAVAGALWVVPTLPPEWLAGTPFPELWVMISGVVELAGAAMILTNRWPRLGAWLIAIFLVPVTIAVHGHLLMNAPDEDFQDMWLEMMMEHHEGAIEMAETVRDEGTFADAIAMAESIVTSQQAEIDQIEELLGS